MSDPEHERAVNHFAADAIRKQLHALLKERDGVTAAEDLEFVHHMRVASRRLRTALDLFEDQLSDKRFARCRKQVRRLTRALGAARDCDVQLIFLHDFSRGVRNRAPLPGVERLLLRLGQHRAELQKNVIRALNRFESSGVVADLKDELSKLELNGHEAHGADLKRLAAQRISDRLDTMLHYERYIEQAGCDAERHAMRIAAKHLRYAMEIFAPLFADELRLPLKAARDVQDKLGALHDCEVWISLLQEFTEAERERTLKYFGHLDHFDDLTAGIEAIGDDRRRAKGELHADFVNYWKNLGKDSLWQTLRKAAEEQS